jgi:hypothetical protein
MSNNTEYPQITSTITTVITCSDAGILDTVDSSTEEWIILRNEQAYQICLKMTRSCNQNKTKN